MEVILETRGLGKTYKMGKDNHLDILKDINLQVHKGEFVTVMGPSGSGKSTLLYNISGMDRMTAGSVQFNGREIGSLSEKELANLRLYEMGFIFQQNHLLRDLNIFDNIILSAFLAKKHTRKKIIKEAKKLMKQTDIEQLADHDITQVSGGQLQRAAICRALINHPKMLFGDEPTGALNSKSASEMMEILANINQAGTSILLVTHDVNVAAKTERILYMMDGTIVSEKNIGKYKQGNNDFQARKELLSKWLIGMGF